MPSSSASSSNNDNDGSDSIVTSIGPNDVLMGRGAPATDWEGNKRLRALAADRRAEYAACHRHREKQRVALEIMEEVRRRGGRFLKRVDDRHRQIAGNDSTTAAPRYRIMGIAHHTNEPRIIIDKVKQLLRDAAPEVKEGRIWRKREALLQKRRQQQQQQQASWLSSGTAPSAASSLMMTLGSPPAPSLRALLAAQRDGRGPSLTLPTSSATEASPQNTVTAQTAAPTRRATTTRRAEDSPPRILPTTVEPLPHFDSAATGNAASSSLEEIAKMNWQGGGRVGNWQKDQRTPGEMTQMPFEPRTSAASTDNQRHNNSDVSGMLALLQQQQRERQQQQGNIDWTLRQRLMSTSGRNIGLNDAVSSSGNSNANSRLAASLQALQAQRQGQQQLPLHTTDWRHANDGTERALQSHEDSQRSLRELERHGQALQIFGNRESTSVTSPLTALRSATAHGNPESADARMPLDIETLAALRALQQGQNPSSSLDVSSPSSLSSLAALLHGGDLNASHRSAATNSASSAAAASAQHTMLREQSHNSNNNNHHGDIAALLLTRQRRQAAAEALTQRQEQERQEQTLLALLAQQQQQQRQQLLLQQEPSLRTSLALARLQQQQQQQQQQQLGSHNAPSPQDENAASSLRQVSSHPLFGSEEPTSRMLRELQRRLGDRNNNSHDNGDGVSNGGDDSAAQLWNRIRQWSPPG